MKPNSRIDIKSNNSKLDNIKNDIKYNLYWILKPISLTLLIFGLEKTQKGLPVRNKIKIYSVLFYIILALLQIALIYMMHFHYKTTEEITNGVFDLLIIIPTYLSVFVTLLSSVHFSPNVIIKFIKNMDVIDEFLNINRKLSYTPFRKQLIVLHVSYVIFMVIRLFYDYFFWNISFTMLFWYINELMLHLTMTEFIIYLVVVKTELSVLNTALREMTNVNSLEPFRTYTLRIRDVMKEKYNLQKMDQDLKRLSSMSVDKKRNTKIVQLLKVYDKIADNMDILNLCYGAPLLFISGATFVNILSLIKDCIVYSSKFQEFWATSKTLVWCISSLWWTMLSAYKCATLTQQGNETLDIVNKMTIQPHLDAAELKILERFSLSVSSRQLNISACNFFPYNFTFIQSLVGAMVSYGIILLQVGQT